MKDIFTGLIIKGCGKQTIEGLFDSEGRAVNVILEKSEDEVILAVMYDNGDETYSRQPRDCGISDEEIDMVCQAQDNCDDCPLYENCAEEWEDE
ncbi:hypothetical protein SAMN02910447_03159 [Ruminococcus sp. YE71]|uniref:hypothetical protein n=1 Tax=unclassified Ruminococcus TaxID=2608920 RepID=UPI000882AD67|nr:MULTISPECIES: hypothetical protein [unclassified Ruminococcus]SDA30280.1 hypothetical protein SAMN02910446_03230 [Ruminococcus sp. YE78]SFW49346.1 hypothetical protein SAMN02910447_03159 [Ruminococcus sp. YE71]